MKYHQKIVDVIGTERKDAHPKTTPSTRGRI